MKIKGKFKKAEFYVFELRTGSGRLVQLGIVNDLEKELNSIIRTVPGTKDWSVELVAGFEDVESAWESLKIIMEEEDFEVSPWFSDEIAKKVYKAEVVSCLRVLASDENDLF